LDMHVFIHANIYKFQLRPLLLARTDLQLQSSTLRAFEPCKTHSQATFESFIPPFFPNMAARSMRSQRYSPSEALLPVDYQGLDTSNQLRSHSEEFQKAKAEIALDNRSRRNSINDNRNTGNIAADGPDKRFEGIQIPDSGIRD
jgi:hypothetical protein